MLNDSVCKNAEIEIDQKTRACMSRLSLNYSDAYRKVLANDPELAKRYAYGADAVIEKRYSGDTLSPARQQLNALVADAGRTQVLAGAVLDQLDDQDRQATWARSDNAFARSSKAKFKRLLS